MPAAVCGVGQATAQGYDYTRDIQLYASTVYTFCIPKQPRQWRYTVHCRAMLAMHKHGLCRHVVSVCVCVCVCLFVTFVDHVKTNKHIFEIFLSRV